MHTLQLQGCLCCGRAAELRQVSWLSSHSTELLWISRNIVGFFCLFYYYYFDKWDGFFLKDKNI